MKLTISWYTPESFILVASQSKMMEAIYIDIWHFLPVEYLHVS